MGADQAPGLANLFIWGPKSGRPEPCWVPWSDCVADLVLQMNKATGWDHYLGAIGRNLICQDPSAACYKPLPTSPSPSDSQWSRPTDSPVIFMRQYWSEGSQEVIHSARGAGCQPYTLFSHCRNHRLRGDLSAWFCTSLGKGQCAQHVTLLLAF